MLNVFFQKKGQRKCGTDDSKTINVTLIANAKTSPFFFSSSFSLSSFLPLLFPLAHFQTNHSFPPLDHVFPSPVEEINLGSCWTRVTKRPRTFVLLLSFDNGRLLTVNERKSFLTLIYVREIRVNDSPKDRATLSRIFTKRDGSWRIFLDENIRISYFFKFYKQNEIKIVFTKNLRLNFGKVFVLL